MNKQLSGVRADHKLSYRTIEVYAVQARQYLKLSPFDALNPLSLFENLDLIRIRLRNASVIPLRNGVEALEDSEGYARYDARNNLLEILASQDTYSRLEAGHPRAGYFVAHELGHCVLHSDQLVRLAKMPTHQQAAYHRGRADHEAYQDTEWQANAFASALLMPARGLESLEGNLGCLTVSMIANQFGVSHEAAKYRLQLFEGRRCQLLI